MEAESRIINKLESVDWDFIGSSTQPRSVHSLHWYPGNIIPQIPSYLISLLSKGSDLVFDPFCGSGTVGIEALQLGRKTWQSDICRAGIEIARGKLICVFRADILPALQEIYNSLFYENYCFTDEIGQNGEGSNKELKYWLNDITYGELRYIWSIIENQKSTAIQEVLRMLFTDTLFACSSTGSSKTSSGKIRRHHWGWVADNVHPKKPFRHSAIEIFKQNLMDTMRITRSIEVSKGKKQIDFDEYNVLLLEDARNSSIRSASVDLVVTSPPFLGMTDYTLANRLTYLWMGWPMSEDFKNELGSRRTRNRKNIEQEYLDDMTKAWKTIHRALKPEGICAVLIGASRKFPYLVENFINRVNRLEFKLLWGPKVRTLSRRRVSERTGARSQEFICVWRKR